MRPPRIAADLPLVLIHWRDAYLISDWDTYDEPVPLSGTLTVGLLRRRTKETFEVVQSATAHGEFDALLVIPRSQVKRVVYLKAGKRGRR